MGCHDMNSKLVDSRKYAQGAELSTIWSDKRKLDDNSRALYVSIGIWHIVLCRMVAAFAIERIMQEVLCRCNRDWRG